MLTEGEDPKLRRGQEGGKLVRVQVYGRKDKREEKGREDTGDGAKGAGREEGKGERRCRHDLLPLSATLSAIGNVAFHLAPPPLSSAPLLISLPTTIPFISGKRLRKSQNNPSLLSPHSALRTRGNTTTFTVYNSVCVSALVDGAQLLFCHFAY